MKGKERERKEERERESKREWEEESEREWKGDRMGKIKRGGRERIADNGKIKHRMEEGKREEGR